MTYRNATAKTLMPGDMLTGSGATVVQTWTDGLFAHGVDGAILTPRRAFPKGRVEVFVTYPSDRTTVVRCEYNARTTMRVSRDN